MALCRRQSEGGSLIRISPLTPSLQQWPSPPGCRPVPRPEAPGPTQLGREPLAVAPWSELFWVFVLSKQELRCLWSFLFRNSSSSPGCWCGWWWWWRVVGGGPWCWRSCLESCLPLSFSFPPGASLRSATPVSLEPFWDAELPDSLSRLQESRGWVGAVRDRGGRLWLAERRWGCEGRLRRNKS